MKKILATVFWTFLYLAGSAQTDPLAVKEWRSFSPTPLLFYISGDGGLNQFSIDLCNNLNVSGYGIAAVNAKAYFWNKKTPEQTAAAIGAYLEKQFQNRNNQQLVLLGYSFGADVMPFIVNRLPNAIRAKLVSVVLLSPSGSTNFEVHWLDMFGAGIKRSMDVVAEINRMGDQKTAAIFGDDENGLPVENIKLKNYRNENLPGGHHFNGNTNEVAKTIIKYLK